MSKLIYNFEYRVVAYEVREYYFMEEKQTGSYNKLKCNS